MADIEQLARAHWWHRVRQTTYADQALAVCMGAADSQAQLAADEINQAWDEVRDVETEAMQAALGAATFADLLHCLYNVPSAHTQPR